MAVEPEPQHPLLGEWTYTLDTPQGVYTGTMIFSMEADVLGGVLVLDTAPEDTASFEPTYDIDTAEVAFFFDTGEYGIMDFSLTLGEDDMLRGNPFLRDYSFELDLVASRKENDAADQQ